MSKYTSAPLAGILLFVLCLFGSVVAHATGQSAPDTVTTTNASAPDGEELPFTFDPQTGERIIPNSRCLDCHGDAQHKTDVRDDGTPCAPPPDRAGRTVDFHPRTVASEDRVVATQM